MKRIDLSLFNLLILLCIALLSLAIILMARTTPKVSTTTTTVQISSLVCVQVPATSQALGNMVDLGYDVAYENGEWTVNEITIGTAEEEDEPFFACGPAWLINTIDHLQGEQ